MRHISELSLKEKIGQLVMCGFEGEQPSEEITYLIHEKHIGGVIYFARNIGEVSQVHQLSEALNAVTNETNGIPLFIAIDQEGGMIARLTKGVTLMPGNMALGAINDNDSVYKAAKIVGQELRCLGINVNFAPSLDVNNNPKNPVIGVRSFSDRPEIVSHLGVAAIKGYQDANICAAAKHFPGHGDTAKDSHFDLPVIPHNMERFNDVELVPFKKAIEAGTDMIMTAHIVMPALDDSSNPATLSYKIMTGLLREKLDYNGVIVTDCLEMNAISETVGVAEAAVMAIEAGVDLVLVSHRYDRQLSAIDAIGKAVASGRISVQRINESVSRILELKERRYINALMPGLHASLACLRLEEHVEFMTTTSERSITVIKDEANNLPLNPEKSTFVIFPNIEALNPADEQIKQTETLGTYLGSSLPHFIERQVSPSLKDEKIESLIDEAKGYDQVIVASYNTDVFPNQVSLVKKLYEIIGERLIVVAIRNPYDFMAFPEVKTQIACYESRPLALESTAKILLGKVQPEGTLPVQF